MALEIAQATGNWHAAKRSAMFLQPKLLIIATLKIIVLSLKILAVFPQIPKHCD